MFFLVDGGNTPTMPNTLPTPAGSGAGGIAGGIIGALIAVALIVVIVILVVWLWRWGTCRDTKSLQWGSHSTSCTLTSLAWGFLPALLSHIPTSPCLHTVILIDKILYCMYCREQNSKACLAWTHGNTILKSSIYFAHIVLPTNWHEYLSFTFRSKPYLTVKWCAKFSIFCTNENFPLYGM